MEPTTVTTTETPKAKPVRKPAKKPAKAKAAASANGKPKVRDPRLPKAGSTIKRTYKGKDYAIKVKTDTFELGGKSYGSLTAVAKAIIKSDSEINGYAFFGLTK